MRLRLNWLGLMLGAVLTLAPIVAAQQPTPAPAAPAPDTTAAPQQPAASQAPPNPQPAPAGQTANPAGTKGKEAYDPSRTDQLFSLEADYWLTRGEQPTLRGGKDFAYMGGSVLDYPGKPKNGFGAKLVIPLPSRSDIRIEVFRVQGNGTTTLGTASTYFTVPFAAGDYLSPSYTLGNFRMSYEYLSLPWPPETKKWRLYTLYEIQYTNIKTTIDAPFKAKVDSNGNAVTTTATGSHYIVYPTFGLKFEYPVTKSFRFEAEASAFGWPHKAGQWNAEVTGAIHVGNIEIRAGGKAFYYKTSPNSNEYFSATVYGAYVGLRYSLKPFKIH